MWQCPVALAPSSAGVLKMWPRSSMLNVYANLPFGWAQPCVTLRRLSHCCYCCWCRFEPCGLNQLYAMRYGTVPIAHATGGLMDTIENYNPFSKGAGFGGPRQASA